METLLKNLTASEVLFRDKYVIDNNYKKYQSLLLDIYN